jgi:hypothetical protein
MFSLTSRQAGEAKGEYGARRHNKIVELEAQGLEARPIADGLGFYAKHEAEESGDSYEWLEAYVSLLG